MSTTGEHGNAHMWWTSMSVPWQITPLTLPPFRQAMHARTCTAFLLQNFGHMVQVPHVPDACWLSTHFYYCYCSYCYFCYYYYYGAGEHGNAELVNKYGFALADNPFDCVKLDKTSLVGIATKHMGREICQQRCTFLSDQR